MPGPVLNIDPSKKPIWDGVPVLSTILNTLFGETPAEQIEGISKPGGAPLVSIYKNPAARRLATQGFLKKAMEMGEGMFNSASQFAARYPRIAAHTILRDDLLDDGTRLMEGTRTRATTVTPRGKVTSQIPVIFNKDAIEGPSRDLTNTVFHEGAHVAQSLGNRESNRLYQLFRKLDEVGYKHHPMEIAAKNAGARAADTETKIVKRLARPYMQETLERAERYQLPPSHDRFLEQKRTLDEIRQIMQKRGMLRDNNVTPETVAPKAWISRE